MNVWISNIIRYAFSGSIMYSFFIVLELWFYSFPSHDITSDYFNVASPKSQLVYRLEYGYPPVVVGCVYYY